MKIVGLDLSLTASGYADDDEAITFKAPDGKATKIVGMERIDWYRDRLLDPDAIDPHLTDLVVIEGYSFASANSQAHALGELGGLIRWTLWRQGVPWVEVAPSSLKKFATNKGGAHKDLMIATASRLGCLANDNNAVDAWWLRQMGCYHYNAYTQVPATGYRTETVAKIDWPTLANDEKGAA